MKKSLVTLLVGICLILVLVGLPFMVACAKPAPGPKAEPIVLKAIQMWTIGHSNNWEFEALAERINKRAKGELTIKLVGGPEAIAVKDQTTAAIKGVVDIAHTSPSWVTQFIPEIEALSLRGLEITTKQLEERGVIDVYRELFKKQGLYFLGVLNDWHPHMLFTKFEVKTPKDLAGHKIRTFPTVKPFVERLGATPVALPIEEIYTAMERGVVEGFFSVLIGSKEQGYLEVTKYCIFHDVLVGNVLVVINLDSWNRLPKHLQELILKTKLEMLDEMSKYRKGLFDREVEGMKKAGIKFIEFSPADAKAYRELCAEAVWTDLLKKSPEAGAKLKELLRR